MTFAEAFFSLQLREGENLLMALVRLRFPLHFFCTTGKCATCRYRMEIPSVSGMGPSDTERYRLGEEALKSGIRLACQVQVTGPLTVYLTDAERTDD